MQAATHRLHLLTRSFTLSSIARRTMSSPTESHKPIVLYTAVTPNGLKVSTFLEELRAHYGGPEYEYVTSRDSWAWAPNVNLVYLAEWSGLISPRMCRRSLGSLNSTPTAAFR